MSEFEHNFNLVQMLLSRRVTPDLAHRIAHESLDKPDFLTMDDPIRTLHAELHRPQRGDLRSMPGHRRVVAKVDALRLAELTDPQSLVNSLTPGEPEVMAQALDVFVEEGEELSSNLLVYLNSEGVELLTVLSDLKARMAREPVPALGSVIGKLTGLLRRRQQRRGEFAGGLTVQEYEVVYMALDLWS
jgi:hypothetical protein